MSAEDSRLSRRQALGASAAASLALLVESKAADAAGLATGYSLSEKDCNNQLAAYGLPQMEKVPGGFKPLLIPVGGTVGANIDGSKVVESIGSLLTKGGLKRGERVLLNFVYPSAWIVSVPTSTGNGESGTVSANNYVKGDSAVVCALPLEEDEDIESQDKTYFQDLMTQAVPANLWQNFKLVKKTPAGEQGGQEMVDIEYRYDLITSGPIIGRHGFARIVHTGGNAVAMGATTSDTRFKGQKEALITAAKSFRSSKVKAEFAAAGAKAQGMKAPVDAEEDE